MKTSFSHRISLDGDWALYYTEHHEHLQTMVYPTAHTLEESGFSHVAATVPGNFEIDLERAGALDDGNNRFAYRSKASRALREDARCFPLPTVLRRKVQV